MAPLGTTAKTGQSRPESGVWAPIAKHNTMPPYANQSVTWRLKQYA